MSYQEREQKHLQTVLLTAMMMAIILVLTYLVRIPAVATRGYIHLGDAAIFLAVLILGPRFGAIAGGFGSALADLLGGFAYFAPVTLVVKALMAYVLGAFLHGALKKPRGFGATMGITAVGMTLAGLLMVGGYYLAEAVMYGSFVVPLTELPLNVLQFVAAMALSLPLGVSLSRTPFGRTFAYDLKGTALDK